MIDKSNSKTITFTLGNMVFEYDEWKNEYNLQHHGISFRNAARVFFDYDRIELYDEQNSEKIDITRLISARQATNFERGLYYGKYQ